MRSHGLAFQGVVTPDGMLASLVGPFDGRHNDQYMLHDPSFVSWLRDIAGRGFMLYGDKGYNMGRGLCVPFKGSNLTPREDSFNRMMSGARIAVEWAFGKVLQQFPALDFTRELKIGHMPLGLLYSVAAFLINVLNCYHPNQAAIAFATRTLTAVEYVGLAKAYPDGVRDTSVPIPPAPQQPREQTARAS